MNKFDCKSQIRTSFWYSSLKPLMLDRILDDFMLKTNITWTGRCLCHCTKVDESGVEGQSKYRIRIIVGK